MFSNLHTYKIAVSVVTTGIRLGCCFALFLRFINGQELGEILDHNAVALLVMNQRVTLLCKPGDILVNLGLSIFNLLVYQFQARDCPRYDVNGTLRIRLELMKLSLFLRDDINIDFLDR